FKRNNIKNFLNNFNTIYYIIIMTSLNNNVYTIFNQDIYKDIANLYKNGEFYQQNDELEGALISYSSCASMIDTILQINYDFTPK
mgnify:CR=1